MSIEINDGFIEDYSTFNYGILKNLLIFVLRN